MGEVILLSDRGDNWDTFANCGELQRLSPETFDDYFYSKDTDRAVARMAKRICSLCPVKQLCLEDAVAHHDNFGIKGGMTPRERRDYAKSSK